MDKYQIAHILREIATLIELEDDNPKKAIAYRKAANSIEAALNFDELIKDNKLETLPGIGKKISGIIINLLEKGYSPYHYHLKKIVPLTLLELTNIPGLNTKKIRILFEKLHITSLKDLQKALHEKQLNGLSGFSPSFIDKLESRALIENNPILYPRAYYLAEGLIQALKPFTNQLEVTGELRRKNELVESIPIIATTNYPKKCLDQFKKHTFIQKVISHNSLEATVFLKQGIQASLKIVEEIDFASQLLITTGNEKHVAALKDFKQGATEEEIYAQFGLNFIPPELREGFGEIEQAKVDDFSDLIRDTDLKGTFHCHTQDSDGRNTIEEMAKAAKNMDWQYLGISDHSKSTTIANGLSEERLQNQIEKIQKLNKDLAASFHIFAGVECDILKEGDLDVSEFLLKQLDFVIISIHSFFKLDKETMTKRLIKAIENPYTTMVGHLTGRLLRIRAPYELDIPKIIDACIANDKIIELNAYPDRMDMDWRLWIQYRDRGLKCSINPDAHSIKDLMNCHFGINIARKGWLKKRDVINTLSLKEMRLFLKKHHP